MKKTISALFAIASAAAFAGAGDVRIMFSTPGIDRYADGETVLKGESYALVYTKGDVQTTVLTYPTLEAGHCTPVLFIVDEKDVSKYTGGSWGVYLLDTRDYEADGEGKTLSDWKDGQPSVVNVKTKASDAVITEALNTTGASSAVAFSDADIPQPKVTGIRIEGATIYVNVSDIVPCLEYTLQSGTNPADKKSFSVPDGVAKDPSSTIKNITLTVPKGEGENAQFFKVVTSTVK